MSEHSRIQKLKEISFFDEVAEQDLKEIAAITVEKSYDSGEIIIEENSRAETFFIIHKGKIEILKKFEDGEEVILGMYSDGEFFGEMAILDEGPRSATARAVDSTTVMEVSYKDFEKVLGVVPQIAYSIMKELSTRLRQTGALLVWELKRKNRELAEASYKTVKSVMNVIEERTPYMTGHAESVAALARTIGKNLGLDDEELYQMQIGCLLHDVGMIGVGESILLDKNTVDSDSFEQIQQHVIHGKQMIENIEYLKPMIPHVLYHHERYDGSGYPEGLKGDSIPFSARIIAVADVFSALISDRPHRSRISEKDAATFIKESAGIMFDPVIVKSFLQTLKT